MAANMRDLYFDLKHSVGPMRAADTCEFGLKQVRFSSLASVIHVELSHGMQCSTLAAAVLPFKLLKLFKLLASLNYRRQTPASSTQPSD